jgi:hypothetical protein
MTATKSRAREQSMKDCDMLSARLGASRAAVDITLAHLAGDNVMRRLWQRDHTLWKTGAPGIADRLGWLDVHQRLGREVVQYSETVRELRREGFRRVLWLASGAAAQVADLYRQSFEAHEGFPQLTVLDTTEPQAVRRCAESLSAEQTLWVAASQSGRTLETLSLLRYFYGCAREALGRRGAGRHFVALTERDSPLAAMAAEWDFRCVIETDPTLTGSYGALSPLGLWPAACIGVDLPRLVASAQAMAQRCGPDVAPADNPAAFLGALLGELAREGRNKLTLLPAEGSLGASLARWLEPLIAGSTGKEGRGILPVVGESLEAPATYGADRLFVDIRQAGAFRPTETLRRLEEAGHPVVRLTLEDPYELGGQVVLWQLATALAAHCLGVDPFALPDVTAVGRNAQRLVTTFKETGQLSSSPPLLSDGVLSYYGSADDLGGETPMEALEALLRSLRQPTYVALLAYLDPLPTTVGALESLRCRIRNELGLAVTLGYGPRLCHGVGQLHLGDAGRGCFLQLTADHCLDQPIPDEMSFRQGVVSFAVLHAALAAGHGQALRQAGRPVVRLHLGEEVSLGLAMLERLFLPRRTSSMPPR